MRHVLIALALLGLLSACTRGSSSPPGPVNPGPSGAPANPAAFNAAAASPTSVNLSWSAVEGATRYTLERKTGGGAYAAVGGSSLTVTSYTDAGLAPNTAYTYRLKAVNAEGSSSGLEREVTTPPATPPTPGTIPATPAQLTATTASSTSINLTWSAVGGATRYALERKTGNGAFAAIGGNNLTTTSYTDTALSPSTSYTYRVSAVNALGSSSPRESATLTTPASPVSNPSSFTATATSPTSVTLAWSAVGGATRYSLERRTGSGAFAAVGGDNLTAVSYSDTGLAAGTAYTYRIRTMVGASFSSGLERTVTTPSTSPPPTGDLNLRRVLVASGLNQPLYLTHAGDPDLYVVQKSGQIRLIENGQLRQAPFLDIASRVSTGSEQGLLGLAFHPNYAQNAYFFVNYTNTAGDTIIARFTADRSAKTAAGSSERVLLTIDQPYDNHNGGWIGFGRDGMLYIATGDGGAGGDPGNRAQNPSSLLGKMLRIDVNGTGSGSYSIPSDNPSLGGRITEVWALGLRNPWRASFDRQTGDLWLGDVGQDSREEINLGTGGGRGLNYGWKVMEGNNCYGSSTCNRSGLTLPVFDYGRGDGYSVTGGYVYRGSRFPRMQGRYFFGDFGSGNLWSLRQSGSSWTRRTELSGVSGLASFGEDSAGELYVISMFGGQVWRLEDQP